MITLSKVDNAIKFTFVDNGHYLFNGTIEVPLNSLSLVTDDSGMATFKKSASNDIFVSATYEELGMSKADLESWYKDNMVGSTGGGGGGGVDSGTVQTMIDESISGKADSSAVTEEISAATADYFDGAEYDSGTTRINFYHGNTVKAYIDASAFIVDGMIDNVSIETISGVSYLVIDFNTASGKEDIQIPLTDIFDPSNYYTKDEVDAAISAATDDMATQTWVGEQGYITGVDLSNYATLDNVSEATSGKVDTTTYTAYTAATDTEIGNKLAISDFNSYSGTVDTAINSKASESDLSALTDVVTAHTANTDIHVTTAQTAAWNAKSDFSGSYNDLTDKPTIPTVPTSNTAFTNDAGYITSDAISGKVDTTTYTAYTAATDTVLSNKQTTLTAGTNITIIDNVISATGGGGGNPTVELTQAEYDALVTAGTVSADTYYIITDATAVDMANYYTTAQTNTRISQATSGKVDTTTYTAYTAATDTVLSGKQDTLSAGTNITIIDNVISAEGGGGKAIEAGRGITVTTGATADTVAFDLPIYSNSTNLLFGNSANTLSFTGSKHDNNNVFGKNNVISSTTPSYETSDNIVFGENNLIGLSGTSVGGISNLIVGRSNKIQYSNSSLSARNIEYVTLFGYSNQCNNGGSHRTIAGYVNTSNNSFQTIFGSYNTCNNQYEFATGIANISNTGSTTADKTIFSVGNGTSSYARHNAFEIRQNGDIYISSGGTDIKLQDNLGGGEVSTAITSGDTNAVAGGAVYAKFDEVEQVTAAGLNVLNDKFGGLKLVKLTQSEYNALSPNYDNNTLYVIVN